MAGFSGSGYVRAWSGKLSDVEEHIGVPEPVRGYYAYLPELSLHVHDGRTRRAGDGGGGCPGACAAVVWDSSRDGLEDYLRWEPGGFAAALEGYLRGAGRDRDADGLPEAACDLYLPATPA